MEFLTLLHQSGGAIAPTFRSSLPGSLSERGDISLEAVSGVFFVVEHRCALRIARLSVVRANGLALVRCDTRTNAQA